MENGTQNGGAGLSLRPYQVEPVNKAIAYLRSPSTEPSLIVLPTGWGKSILIAYAAASLPQGEKLLVLQPSRELLQQNSSKYVTLTGGSDAGIYSASLDSREIGRVTYATIGTIKDLGAVFKERGFTKMVVDEAHLYPRSEESMIGRFLSESGIRQVLGVTATPLKLLSTRIKEGKHFEAWSQLVMLTNPSPEGNFYKRILHVEQAWNMARQGWWAPLVYKRSKFDAKALRMNASGSDYTEKSVLDAYVQNKVRQMIMRTLQIYPQRRSVLVFVPSVEEALFLAMTTDSSACLSATTPSKERAAIVKGFKEGTIRVLFNVSVAGTGFDAPDIDMVILASSTASVARYSQFVGRGVRLSPKKADCMIVDLAGNLERFGRAECLWYDPWGKWRLYGEGGRLLSGIPVDCAGLITRSDIIRTYSPTDLQAQVSSSRVPSGLGRSDLKGTTSGGVMRFGKYKGLRMRDVPLSYLTWLLKNGRANDDVIRAIDSNLRDTTGEPPCFIAPDGKYAGLPLEQLPLGYLMTRWCTATWGVTNDRVRRGLMIALQASGVTKDGLLKFRERLIARRRKASEEKKDEDNQ